MKLQLKDEDTNNWLTENFGWTKNTLPLTDVEKYANQELLYTHLEDHNIMSLLVGDFLKGFQSGASSECLFANDMYPTAKRKMKTPQGQIVTDWNCLKELLQLDFFTYFLVRMDAWPEELDVELITPDRLSMRIDLGYTEAFELVYRLKEEQGIPSEWPLFALASEKAAEEKKSPPLAKLDPEHFGGGLSWKYVMFAIKCDRCAILHLHSKWWTIAARESFNEDVRWVEKEHDIDMLVKLIGNSTITYAQARKKMQTIENLTKIHQKIFLAGLTGLVDCMHYLEYEYLTGTLEETDPAYEITTQRVHLNLQYLFSLRLNPIGWLLHMHINDGRELSGTLKNLPVEVLKTLLTLLVD
jgi:hypothetical protein